MAKKEILNEYEKNGRKYVRCKETGDWGNTLYQKEFPKDNGIEGLHFIYGHKERLHVDYPTKNGYKQEYFDEVNFYGSTCVVSGENIIEKSPNEYIVCMPIRSSPDELKIEDLGSIAKVDVNSKGKIFYALIKKCDSEAHIIQNFIDK